MLYYFIQFDFCFQLSFSYSKSRHYVLSRLRKGIFFYFLLLIFHNFTRVVEFNTSLRFFCYILYHYDSFLFHFQCICFCFLLWLFTILLLFLAAIFFVLWWWSYFWLYLLMDSAGAWRYTIYSYLISTYYWYIITPCRRMPKGQGLSGHWNSKLWEIFGILTLKGLNRIYLRHCDKE